MRGLKDVQVLGQVTESRCLIDRDLAPNLLQARTVVLEAERADRAHGGRWLPCRLVQSVPSNREATSPALRELKCDDLAGVQLPSSEGIDRDVGGQRPDRDVVPEREVWREARG